MTPWQTAAEWQKEHSPEGFEECIGRHLSNGFVWSTPYCFMLASEVYWDKEREAFGLNGEDPNAWFVTLAASNEACASAAKEFMRIAPWKHPWALWCRRGEMRVRAFDWEKLSRKVGLN